MIWVPAAVPKRHHVRCCSTARSRAAGTVAHLALAAVRWSPHRRKPLAVAAARRAKQTLRWAPNRTAEAESPAATPSRRSGCDGMNGGWRLVSLLGVSVVRVALRIMAAQCSGNVFDASVREFVTRLGWARRLMRRIGAGPNHRGFFMPAAHTILPMLHACYTAPKVRAQRVARILGPRRVAPACQRPSSEREGASSAENHIDPCSNCIILDVRRNEGNISVPVRWGLALQCRERNAFLRTSGLRDVQAQRCYLRSQRHCEKLGCLDRRHR